VQICLRGITDLGEILNPLLAVHGGKRNHNTLLILVDGEVGDEVG